MPSPDFSPCPTFVRPILTTARRDAAGTDFPRRIRRNFSKTRSVRFSPTTASAATPIRSSAVCVSTREGMKKGGKRGPSIVAGDPENSLLIKAVRQTDPALKMPYGGKLKDAEIADLEAWIKAGAAWPATASATTTSKDGKYVISPERRNFWSFLPLKSPTDPPSRTPSGRRRISIASFLRGWRRKDSNRSPAATKHDLLRRAYLRPYRASAHA